MRKRFTLFLLLIIPLWGHGQSAKLYTADRELSSSLINRVYQDRNGMIWVATEDGLNRYDGAKFTIYRHESGNVHSLMHNYVNFIAEDSKGHLVVGTYSGVQMYDPELDRFTPPATWEHGGTFEGNVTDFLERKNGEVWLSGNALCGLIIHDDRLFVRRLSLPIPTSMVGTLIEDRNYTLWMMRGEEGIYRMDADNQIRQYTNLNASSICEDQNGDIYASTMGNGLFKYDVDTDSFVNISSREQLNLPVKTLYSNSQNELYMGTDGKGIKIFISRTLQIINYDFDNTYFDSKTSKVHAILKDNAGNLWLGVYQKGLMKIPQQPNSFKYMGYKSIDKNIVGSNCITALFKDHEGVMWVGTDNDGIYGVTENGKQKVHYKITDSPFSVPSTVFSLYEDSKHNLWCGSFLNGMGKLDKETGLCTYRKDLLDHDGKRVPRVYDFAEDNDQRLWIATMGSGLFYYDLKTDRIVYNRKMNAGINTWVTCLRHSKDNIIYAGTYDGLYSIIPDAEEPKIQKMLVKQIIHSIFEDHQGIIWIGSAEGLFKWDPQTQRMSSYTTADGLPSNAIYAIQEDEQHNVWISTNEGLSKLYPESQQFFNYYVGDGLQGNEFSKNASFKDNKGNIWFGGMNGITYFNPWEIINPAKKWTVRITDFYLHNQPVRKGMLSDGHDIIDAPVFEAEEFHLSHKDNAFSIEFSTQELTDPERMTYYYAMNDDAWVALSAGTNRVSFSNLIPGTYRFRLKVVDYTIESDVKEIMIHIRPPWWATWWAKLLYVLFTIGVVIGIAMQIRHRYRMRQEMMQHVHAEQINEAKLQFFIDISHEIRTPMSLIISPLQKLMSSDTDKVRQKTYHTIYHSAERILKLMNQLMDIRKIDKKQMSFVYYETDIVKYLDDLCDAFAQDASKKNITLTCHHPEETGELFLWVDPGSFDKIILNILSNAIKFTPNQGHIDVYLATGEDKEVDGPLSRYAEITIADNGIGIPLAERERVFERFYQIRNNVNNSGVGTGIGLQLTRSLVELHQGDIRIESNPNEAPGTRFIIRLPMGRDHLRVEDIGKKEEKEATVSSPVEEMIDPEEMMDQEREAVGRSRTKSRILIVEDDEEIRRYIREELSDEFHVQESNNGKDALELIFKRMPDLVISDVMMNEMDGFTLCRKIKQNVNLNHIPVILLTAKTTDDDNIEGLDTGTDAYLTKPFNMEILRKTVKNLIRSRERLRNTFSGQQHQEDKLQKIDMLSPDDRLMERVMRVVNENLSNPNLTVTMICNEIGISRVHLHRKLKELTNQTTRDFIRNMRLKQAANLLSEKRYTIAEIAELTGFSDPNNFSTVFKELYGVPPTVYMEERLNGKGDE
ncbi:signal transduction histidine kinase/ligand-binding sensor domain-containing protein/DNA-binding response OmpR family regulator [Parabacteroides sp. PFB2-10]|uniref:hybrid sensor histidine kinase/response regulator transcription factor n=1 Tax=Parabacteroides sp. PFB2-10 TaxID=1742405 RepID=UPI002474E0A1|nr:hybrid sensor histidine kinase/response regulator transcription factor [Parabacteroides sp. PFB2-10]MDH6312105.1 signal transduction histidine kinase/ligand-binding sensor domain-containing protein/DNA-binding response OmpR family regulator [Parabacteroides sp. PFB2-10]